MTAKKPRSKKRLSISHGRPPTAKPPTPSLSSRATRTLIRCHHQLQKVHARALASNDSTLATNVEGKIAANGGMESYQLASKTGQSLDRGGDSSKVLMEWLKPIFAARKHQSRRLQILEIGALSTKNACAKIEELQVTRIDLHSQESGILQQDFMERPLPEDEGDRFDILSLSLVLNYVPDPVARGEMLKRTTAFLRRVSTVGEEAEDFVPCLFLVLPVACVSNSRYLTEDKLVAIMQSLKYSVAKKKMTAKLAYYLWHHRAELGERNIFKKQELNPGRNRNNFAIVMR